MLTVLKNDAAAFANSEFWSEYSNSGLVAALKRNAWGLAGVAAVLLAFSFAQTGRIWVFPSLPVFLFLLVYFIGFLRGLLIDPSFSVKMAVGFCMLLVLHTLFSTFQRRYGCLWEVVNQALLIAAYLLVGLNLFELISGNGFLPRNPRFFGVGGHPNFTGVQMALCAFVLLGNLWTGKACHRLLCAAFLLAALYLLYITGSRTGLLILAGGLVALFSTVRIGYSSLPLMLGALVIGSVVVAVSGSNVTFFTSAEVYDRGGVINTRDAAWTAMLVRVLETPIFGSGKFVGDSENSLLRGWAAIGIVYPIALLAAIGALLIRIMKLGAKQVGRRFPILLAAPFGLICGSILEGYFVDSFTFPIVIWFICMSAISIMANANPPDRGYVSTTRAIASHRI